MSDLDAPGMAEALEQDAAKLIAMGHDPYAAFPDGKYTAGAPSSPGRARRLLPRLCLPPCWQLLRLRPQSLGRSFLWGGGVSFQCGTIGNGRPMAKRGSVKRGRGGMKKGGRAAHIARNIMRNALCSL